MPAKVVGGAGLFDGCFPAKTKKKANCELSIGNGPVRIRRGLCESAQRPQGALLSRPVLEFSHILLALSMTRKNRPNGCPHASIRSSAVPRHINCKTE
jgi:hypothetical protein